MFDENDYSETLDPLTAIFRLKQSIADDIAAKTDPRKKEIGDSVIIWDGSYSQAVDSPYTGYTGIELDDHECIVVAINQQFEKKARFVNRIHNLDVIVYSPKFGCQIRTKSEFIRIVD